MTSAAKQSPLTPVVVGERCIGHLMNRGRDGFEAFNVADKPIGLFADEREAVAALLNAKREGAQ